MLMEKVSCWSLTKIPKRCAIPMPELAEVETIKRGLSPILTNQKIESIFIHHDALRYPLDKNAILSLEGKIITSVARRAKYLLKVILLTIKKALIPKHNEMKKRIIHQKLQH